MQALKRFKAHKFLTNEATILAFLAACREEKNPQLHTQCTLEVARARLHNQSRREHPTTVPDADYMAQSSPR